MVASANCAAPPGRGGGSYVAGLLEVLGDAEPLQVMAELPAALTALTRGVPPEVLRAPEMPGKWSMIEVVHHLADSELVLGYRLRMALAHDEPSLEGFDPDLWAMRLRYRRASLASGLAMLRPLRTANLELVRPLRKSDLRRVAVHTELGASTVANLIRQAAGHDLVHRRQIARIRRVLTLVRAGSG